MQSLPLTPAVRGMIALYIPGWSFVHGYVWPLLNQHRTAVTVAASLIVAVIGLIAAVIGLFPPLIAQYSEWRKRKSQQEDLFYICKTENSDELATRTVGAYRPGSLSMHFSTPEDEEICQAMKEGRDIGILGRSGLGKSFTAVFHMSRFAGWYVIKPLFNAVRADARLPSPERRRAKKRNYFLFLDDLEKYTSKMEGGAAALDLIESLREQVGRLVVVATLQATGFEAHQVDSKFYSKLKWIELSDWKREEGKKMSRITGISMENFDGTPLSVIQPSRRMVATYSRLGPEAKSVLRAVKFLNETGVKQCERNLVKILCASPIFSLSRKEFDAALEEVRGADFLKRDPDHLAVYDAFLAVIEGWAPDPRHDEKYLLDLLVKEQRVDELAAIGGSKYGRADYITAKQVFERCVELRPGSAWYHYLLGVAMRAAGDRKGAETTLLKAIELHPRLARAHRQLARVLCETGRFQQALPFNLKAIAIRPNSPDEWLGLAITHREMSDQKEAEKALRKAIKIQPEFAPAWSHLGSVHRALGQVNDAIGCYQKAIQYDPDQEQSRLELAMVLSEVRADYAAAERQIREAIGLNPEGSRGYSYLVRVLIAAGRIDEAEEAGQKAISQYPDYEQAHFSLGIALQAKENHDGAERAFRKALRLKPDFGLASSYLSSLLVELERLDEAEHESRRAVGLLPDSAESHLALARVLFKKKSYTDAEKELGEAIRLKPDYARAYSYLASVLIELDRLNEAEQASRKALSLSPDTPESRLALGIILFKKKNYADAGKELGEAIRLRPDFGRAFSYLSSVLIELERLDEAEQASRKALTLLPDSPESHLALGIILFKKNYADAEKELGEAIRLKPDFGRAYSYLSSLLIELDRFDEAEQASREVLTLLPDSPETHLALGIVLFRKKNYADAEKELGEAIRLKPDFGRAYSYLSSVLIELERLDEAEQASRKVLTLLPDSPETHLGLGIVLFRKKNYADAERSLARPFAVSRTSGGRTPTWATFCTMLVGWMQPSRRAGRRWNCCLIPPVSTSASAFCSLSETPTPRPKRSCTRPFALSRTSGADIPI